MVSADGSLRACGWSHRPFQWLAQLSPFRTSRRPAHRPTLELYRFFGPLLDELEMLLLGCIHGLGMGENEDADHDRGQ